ncbi:hypothetical protein Nepgr_025953 [Nepenthes gracilis]|uniref:Calcium uniporter protein C-terminal domain-containing protein n=1 Tax=Nepenthes gracilis TaxID=150966 RepID=A0AAD3T625_NEPGR|nr:hypothetical protein Nepgr_025953 [Nepenthes gracilis]
MYHGIRSSLTEGNLMEKLKGMLIARDRLRLEGLCPPEPDPSSGENGLTARDVKKLLRASQMDMVKAKLRQIPKDWISYPEFVQICNESCSNDEEEGVKFAKMLDDSGDVVVLGNAVCLHPEQLMKAFQCLIPFTFLHPNGSRWKELEELEKQKEEIDRNAESLVRRELCFGLGYFVVQTATFMRLTFWELSWDVMEPICFYVTSIYFIFGYSFFLMTSKEPSFKGFFQSRFNSKQKKLFTVRNFDIHRYHELRRGLYPYSSGPLENSLSFFAHSKEYCR